MVHKIRLIAASALTLFLFGYLLYFVKTNPVPPAHGVAGTLRLGGGDQVTEIANTTVYQADTGFGGMPQGSGNPKSVLKADGKVGVGINPPAYPMHVAGVNNASVLVVGERVSDTSINNRFGVKVTANGFTLQDGATLTDGLSQNAGNVGIGTQTPGSYKLNVNGNTNTTGNANVTGTITAGSTVTASGGNSTNWNSAYSHISADGSSHSFINQNVTTSGTPSFTSITAPTYNVTAGNGNGLRFWSSDTYKIHMGNTAEYLYGPVSDYSIKMNMSGGAGRGFTWGATGVAPIAALNSTSGNFQVAGTITGDRFDAQSLSGAGGYISTGNYGGTGTAAYFPSGIWSNGANAWIYGSVTFNGALNGATSFTTSGGVTAGSTINAQTHQLQGGRLYLTNSDWHNWGNSLIDGRVWSASSNIHLSPPNGGSVVINSDYRDAGGTAGGVANLSVSGTVTAPTFSGSLSGNAATASTLNGVTFSGPHGSGYWHLGGWGVARTGNTAVLVNTAYTADYATSAGNSDTVDGYHFNQDLNSGSGPTFNTVYTSNWFRSTGASGWYSQSYGGGWYMDETTRIKAYNSKMVETGGAMRAYRFEDVNDSSYVDPGGTSQVDRIEANYMVTNKSGHGIHIGYYNAAAAIGGRSGGASAQWIRDDGGATLHLLPWGTGGYTAMCLGCGGSISSFTANTTAYKPGGGSWASSSDQRLKKNVRTFTNGLSGIMKLRPVEFQWINPEEHADQTGVRKGFIAQEVERVFPEFVKYDTDYKNKLKVRKDAALVDNGAILSVELPVDFDAMVVDSIQEQQSQIEALKKTVAQFVETLEQTIMRVVNIVLAEKKYDERIERLEKMVRDQQAIIETLRKNK